MASIFVSHSSRDEEPARRVAEQLRTSGFHALFLDSDPMDGIPAGRAWEQQLYVELRKAEAVVFVATPDSVESKWCMLELALARSLGKPVFPVVMMRTKRHPLLSDVQWVDATSDSDSAWVQLIDGLRLAGIDPRDSFAWNPGRSPYPGLEAFRAEDAAVFFGRGQEISKLLDAFHPTLQRDRGRFIAVVGPSGSGKSSLVRAGVIPRLQRQINRWIIVPPMVPGDRPIRHLSHSLARSFAHLGSPLGHTAIEARLREGSDGLVEQAHDLCDLSPAEPSAVLVCVDQAEELLTRSGTKERAAFLGLLSGALSPHSPLWMIATLRSEFLSALISEERLAELIDEPFVVGPLPRARLPEVIARPAQLVGLAVEPGLVERIVNDTAGGDALPLLAFTLLQLLKRSEGSATITAEDYDAVGGVVGALTRQAEATAAGLKASGLGDSVLPTLLKLAHVEAGGEPTGRRLRRAELSPDEWVIIDAFVDARLLTTSGEGDEATVQVAHEALLRQWPPLGDAVERSRRVLELRSDIERLARDWDQAGRDGGYLLRGLRLAEAAGLRDSDLHELGPRERDFVSASRAAAATEIEQARRVNRRLGRLTVGLAAFLVVALVAGGLAWRQTTEARHQGTLARAERDRAEARMLVARAAALTSARPAAATALAVAAFRLADIPDTRSAVISTLSRRRAGAMLGHRDSVNGVAVSPDGKLLASTGQDGSARLWDLATHRQLSVLSGPREAGFSFSPRFSADGSVLAYAAYDGTVRLWDVRAARPLTGPVPARQRGSARGLVVMALSPDASTLAVAPQDGTVRMIEVATGRTSYVGFEGHSSLIRAMVFSPDGRVLVTADDTTVRFWDVAERRQRGPGLPADVTRPPTGSTLAFRPDGNMLAVADGNRVQLVDVASAQTLGEPLQVGGREIYGLAFSPDGTTLAMAGRDGGVRVWDAAQRRPVDDAPLSGHGGAAWDVAFTPDGRTLVVGGDKGSLLLWEMDRPALVPHPAPVDGLAFSPDGKLLASIDTSGVVHLWDLAQRA